MTATTASHDAIDISLAAILSQLQGPKRTYHAATTLSSVEALGSQPTDGIFHHRLEQ